MQERILARQIARDLSNDEIDAVSGGFDFPSFPGFPFPSIPSFPTGGGSSGGSTSTSTSSATNINGVLTTDNSRDS